MTAIMRGPDNTIDKLVGDDKKLYMLFHRLSINDISEDGN